MVTLHSHPHFKAQIQKMAPRFSARIPIKDDPDVGLRPEQLVDYVVQRFRTEAKVVETERPDVFVLMTGPNADEDLAGRVMRQLIRSPRDVTDAYVQLAVTEMIDPLANRNY